MGHTTAMIELKKNYLYIYLSFGLLAAKVKKDACILQRENRNYSRASGG